MKILFYDDASDFGGHEQMVLVAVRHLAGLSEMQVGFMYYAGNEALCQRLKEIQLDHPRLVLVPRDYASIRRQAFRTLVSFAARRKLASELRSWLPDVFVVVQGGIAVSSLALLAGRKAGVRTVSYIPMTHPETAYTASGFKAILREATSRLYYALPDEIYTISERMQAYVSARGIRTPVTVIPNGVDFAAYPLADRAASRRAIGVLDGDFVVAMIGRVEFWQKRQDLGLAAFRIARARHPQLRLLVVGDGPDRQHLDSMVAASETGASVRFIPWTRDMSAIYAAADSILLPSRYEGVPLVMIEAMFFGLPIIATGVDGMADSLPEQWLCPPGDADALAAKIGDIVSNRPASLLARNRQAALEHHDIAEFRHHFHAALEHSASVAALHCPAAAAVRSTDQSERIQ